MATKKQTNWWYVIVMTDEGPKFVTEIGDHHTAYWNYKDAPLELSKEWATDMVKGLTWNGYVAYPVCMPCEIDNQPYNYKKWHIEWKENEPEVEE